MISHEIIFLYEKVLVMNKGIPKIDVEIIYIQDLECDWFVSGFIIFLWNSQVRVS